MRDPGRWLRWAIPAVTAFGIACGASNDSAPEEAKLAAAAFLDEIRSGRVDPAWQGTTVEFKSLMGSDSLRDYVRAHPAMKAPAEFVEGHPVAGRGGELVEYQFRATATAKSKGKGVPTTSTIRVTTAREGGAWKVERLTLN